MGAARKIDDLQILLAVCLVEPGEFRDVFEGLNNLVGPSGGDILIYGEIKNHFANLWIRNLLNTMKVDGIY